MANSKEYIDNLNNWWQSLSEDWRYFFCFNYLYHNNTKRAREFIIDYANQQFAFNIDWEEKYFSFDIIPFTIAQKEFILWNITYNADGETGGVDFKFLDIEPFKYLTHITNFIMSDNIERIDISIIKNFLEVEEIILDNSHKELLETILILNLPSLKKIVVINEKIKKLDQLKALTHIKIEGSDGWEYSVPRYV